MSELNNQLAEKEHNIRDYQALVKRHELEKQEFQAALEEADSALEQTEAKAQKALLEIPDVKAAIERGLAEKEADFEATR